MQIQSKFLRALSHRQSLRNVLFVPLWVCAFIWRRLMFRTTFITVTGSVGKSTATASLATVLSANAPTNWVPGGRNNRFVVAQAILQTRFRHRFTVIEVGTRKPGDIRRAGRLIAPDIVLMLRVLHLHSDVFPTLEEMASEKEQLLNYIPKRGAAILNADDPLVMAMRSRWPGQVRTFGITPDNFVTFSEVSSQWPQRLTFRLHHGDSSTSVETNLAGEHLLTSTVGAAATAVFCGVPLPTLAEGLLKVQPLPARMQPMQLPNGAVVLRDDFNASMSTFQAALTVLRAAESVRRIAIVDEMLDTGLASDERALLLGQLVAAASDIAVFVGEHSHMSMKAAVASGLNCESVFAFQDMSEAAAFLGEELRRGDLVLLKGSIGRHIERLVLAQLGSVSCWVVRCPKQILCEDCPELKLVSIAPAGKLVAQEF